MPTSSAYHSIVTERPHEPFPRPLPHGPRRLPRTRPPLQLSAHLGLCRLPRIRSLLRTDPYAPQRLSGRSQLRMARLRSRPRQLNLPESHRILCRQKHHLARSRNPCWPYSRRYPYQQTLLHAEQSSQQPGGTLCDGPRPRRRSCRHSADAQSRQQLQPLRSAGSNPDVWHLCHVRGRSSRRAL